MNCSPVSVLAGWLAGWLASTFIPEEEHVRARPWSQSPRRGGGEAEHVFRMREWKRRRLFLW